MANLGSQITSAGKTVGSVLYSPITIYNGFRYGQGEKERVDHALKEYNLPQVKVEEWSQEEHYVRVLDLFKTFCYFEIELKSYPKMNPYVFTCWLVLARAFFFMDFLFDRSSQHLRKKPKGKAAAQKFWEVFTRGPGSIYAKIDHQTANTTDANFNQIFNDQGFTADVENKDYIPKIEDIRRMCIEKGLVIIYLLEDKGYRFRLKISPVAKGEVAKKADPKRGSKRVEIASWDRVTADALWLVKAVKDYHNFAAAHQAYLAGNNQNHGAFVADLKTLILTKRGMLPKDLRMLSKNNEGDTGLDYANMSDNELIKETRRIELAFSKSKEWAAFLQTTSHLNKQLVSKKGLAGKASRAMEWVGTSTKKMDKK